jgi:hypothetical protein
MKKLLLLAFLTVGMTANAETVVNNDDDDEQIENKGGIELGKGKDEDDRWSMHLALGVDIPTGAPSGVEFAPFRSWEINWTAFQYDYTPGKSNTTLSAGLGLNWRNYTLSGHKQGFTKNGDFIDVNDVLGSQYDKFSSNIKTTALTMPLLVKQKFSKSFAVSVGAQLNWNFYARIHNYMEQGDHETDVYTKKIGERPITVDVLGMLHFGDFAVYCKYSPMSVLKKDKGPDFKSLAVGFYF